VSDIHIGSAKPISKPSPDCQIASDSGSTDRRSLHSQISDLLTELAALNKGAVLASDQHGDKCKGIVAVMTDWRRRAEWTPSMVLDLDKMLAEADALRLAAEKAVSDASATLAEYYRLWNKWNYNGAKPAAAP
jgi:hypothetical protein